MDNKSTESAIAARACYCDKSKGQNTCGDCIYFEDGKPQSCGTKGHTCHYPGSLPFTGSWCDEHYAKLYHNIDGASDKFKKEFWAFLDVD